MNIINTLKYTITLFVALLLFLNSYAQFQIDGVIRPRFEFRDGYKSLKKSNDEAAAFVSQRSRLSFNYQNEKVKTQITLFDYRVWGDQLWKKDVPSTGIHEVWGEVKIKENATSYNFV